MTEVESVPLEGIPNPGDVLVGKYRVEQVLGVGGMGAVVSATHLQLEERVAIKFLHAATAANPDSVARFLREGKAVIKIRSEHAVKVHDVGRLENGAPYLVMEHLEGSDLDGLLRRHGALPVSDVADMILQGCEAIAEGHSLGIIHRDLKPANLFLTRRADGSPCTKVLDFGISKAAASAQNVTMTRTQTVMGSPRYMSPEQMRSTRAVDARTDVWSLGVILYELLSGSPPFNGESMTELCAQIIQDTPTPLSTLSPHLPRALDAVVQRCLAKEPDRRYPSLAELALELAPFGSASARASAERVTRLVSGGGNVVATRPNLASSPSTVAPFVPARTPVPQRTLDGAASTHATHSSKKLALTVAGVAGALVLAAAVAGFLFFARSHEPSPASAARAIPATPAATASPPPPAPAAAPTPTPVTPVATTATAEVPSAAPSAAPVVPATPAPAPRKHASRSAPSQPPPAADGMFDGRK